METINNLLQENMISGYILAAEDSLVQAKRLNYFFESNNINGVIKKNGVEAFEEALKNKPTIVISDIIMPLMDGYELCKRIKSNPNLNDVPVILLTSLSDPLDIIKGLQAGADNFITKPYDDDYLKSRINYLLRNQSIRKSSGFGEMSIDIMFQDQKFTINSDKKQILDLLLSVYEAAINRNEQLNEAKNQLQILNKNLENANHELESFARTVSHDLKTPLNGVAGFAELLKDNYADKLDKEGVEYIAWILESASSMTLLIEDLLAFSRSSRSDINKEDVNLSIMVNKIIDNFRKANYKGDYDIEIQQDIIVNADKKLMNVVLNNLLSNALKYSQKTKHPEIHFGSREINNKRVIFVKDNGVGFDMNKAESLFQPFVRLHSDNEFQGTGVGLSTVKRIIDRHGGSIWVDSIINTGTVFYFTFD